MSADNYLYIDRKNRVWHCVASCVCHHKKHCLNCQKTYLVGEGKNLEEAMKIADKEERKFLNNGSYIEYGTTRKLWCK